jgi:hypothetical protein
MNEEINRPPSPAEARATLADIDHTQAQIRSDIAQSSVAPIMIITGILWMGNLTISQFGQAIEQSPYGLKYIAPIFTFGGILGLVVFKAFRRYPVMRSCNWRIPVLFLVIFGYAAILFLVAEPWSLLQHLNASDQLMLRHKMFACAFIAVFLGYVITGLWVGRFFVWLGLLMQALILLGFYFLPDYFYLWSGVTGGGAFILSGVFIRKFWK